jgi:hypothetical protein
MYSCLILVWPRMMPLPARKVVAGMIEVVLLAVTEPWLGFMVIVIEEAELLLEEAAELLDEGFMVVAW